MASMMGSRKNRITHGMSECPYGCCRCHITGSKAKTGRTLRTREKRQWRGEA